MAKNPGAGKVVQDKVEGTEVTVASSSTVKTGAKAFIYRTNANNNPFLGAYDPDTGWFGTGDHAGNWSITYYDDKGNPHTLDWNITNEMFTDKNALTQKQITDICNKHNPGLVERGFDTAIYKASQAKGINPKIILSTLQWEQGWCKKGGYDTAFGVGPAGSPNSYGAKDFGGLGSSIDTYLNWYNQGLNLDYPYTMTVNQDKNLKDIGYNGSSKSYVDANPESKNYFVNGQEIEICNAAMYSRIKYNQWLYFPPDKVHTTDVWQNTVMNFGVN